MRIMTIHKSKGLQFKVVVMPFCDWSMEPVSDRQPFLWCSTKGTDFEDLPYVPVKYQKKLMQTYFRKDYTDEFFRNLVDNLNLLYVAFTRAEQGLELIVPKKKSYRGITIAQLILSVLGEDDAEVLFGSIDDIHTKNAESIGRLFPFNNFNSETWKERIRVVNSQSRRKMDIKNQREYGVLLHDILSEIKYEEDFDQVMENYPEDNPLFKNYISEIKKTIKILMRDKTIKNWFSKKWKIRTECEILYQGAALRPDRIVEYNSNEVDIIDYKTGVSKESHQIQVKKYMEVLREMGFGEVRGYLLYTDKGEISEC